MTALALDDVQVMPPCSPQKALRTAAEFTYTAGMTSSSTESTRPSSSQHWSTCSMAAMSAMEQPAARSGRMTVWFDRLRMSAVSAMKWTPQKTT